MALKEESPLTLLFDNLTKGHISRLPIERIPIDGFIGQNIDLIRNFVPSIALGQVKYNSTGLPNSPIRGGCTYTTTAGMKYYVVACGGSLYYSIAGSGTFTQYQIPLHAGNALVPITIADQQTEFSEYNGKLYIINGSYPIINNSDAYYTDSRIIVISGTSVWVITGTEATVPSGAQYIKLDKERLFFANSITSPSGLFWTNAYFDYTIGTPASTTYNPVIFGTSGSTPFTPASGANFDYVGKDDGESISAIYPYQNNLIVFKATNDYTYSTVGDIGNWGSVRVDTIYGCPFNRTIQEMEGYLYWLSYSGIVQFDGTNANLIDDNIRPDIIGVPQLSSASRQWVNGQTADFNAGTFGVDLIDDSGNELQQKSQKTIFASGAFGTSTIQGISELTANIRLLALALASTGTLVNTVANDTNIILATNNSQYQIPYNIPNTTSGTPISPTGFTQTNAPPNPSYYTATFDLGSALIVDSITVSNVGYTAYYSDNNSTWTAGSSGTHRYWQIRATVYLPNQGAYIPLAVVFNYHTIGYNTYTNNSYVPSGSWTSNIIDLGLTPLSMGIFTAITSLPSGTNITFQINTSPNSNMSGSTGFQTVTPGGSIPNTAYRYVQIQANLTTQVVGNGQVNNTPVLEKIMISAPFQSKILDYGLTPVTFGTFAPNVATPSNSSITWYGRSSASSVMSSPTAWVALTAGSAVPAGVTLNRYFQWYALLNPSTDGTQTPQINDVFIAGQWDSAVLNLGVTPTGFQWGKFASTYFLNSQTITFWMRSGTSSNLCLAASWVQQTVGAPVTGVTLNQYIQVEIRFDTNSASQIPTCDGFSVTYYTGVNLEKPCAYVFNKEYCLNIADFGQTINNIV